MRERAPNFTWRIDRTGWFPPFYYWSVEDWSANTYEGSDPGPIGLGIENPAFTYGSAKRQVRRALRELRGETPVLVEEGRE